MKVDMLSILLELGLILVLARAIGWVFSKVGQPAVVGEILAGILLGPSLLGTDLSETIFPLDTRPLLVVIANVGLVLFMFVVGLELDVALIRGRERTAASVSFASILVPFSLGLLLATFLADDHLPKGKDFWPFALYVGAAMSVTAFPVLARILTERKMHRTETGGLALACAATDDILAWTLLAVVIAVGGGTPEAAQTHALGLPAPGGWVVILAAPFALLLILVVRPQLKRLTQAYHGAGRLTPGILAVVLLGILLSAAATEYLGVHFIFGAFLFGAILPHENAAALRHEILSRLEQLSVLLLLPVFFLVAGLAVNLRGLSLENVYQLIAILAVAIVGKYVGAYVGARSAGVPHWQANAIGVLMNTRGLTELVILNVGLSIGLLSANLYTMMVVMAIVTTMMTGPLLKMAYPARRVARDIAEAERLALGDEAADRVLVVAAEGRGSAALIDVAAGLLYGISRKHEIVVAALAPQNRRLEMGSGLTDELAEMAAAMERQQVLVKRGEERGVPVRIIANPSADIAAELVDLDSAIVPQYLVAWQDDETATAAVASAACPVALVAGHLDGVPTGMPIQVRWSPDHDADTAVLLGARLAAAGGAALEVTSAEAGGRRFQSVQEALSAKGLGVAELPVGAIALTVGGFSGSADVRIRAQLDPTPVDWAHVELSTAPQPEPA